MRILHVIDSAGFYGAEGVLLSLMEAQKRLGLTPGLLSLGTYREGLKAIEQESDERGFYVLQIRGSVGEALKTSVEILRRARQWGADVLHSHGYKGDILLGFLPRRIRTFPAVTTIHGWTSARLLSKVGLYQTLAAAAMRNLDATVAVSSRIVTYPALKLFGVHPRVIENGLPELAFPQGLFEREHADIAKTCEGRFKLIAVGRLSPEKGLDLLLRALAWTVEQGLDPVLVIFGEGSERGRLEEAIRNLRLTDRVFLPGYCEKAYRYFPFFDAFVLPSRTEGLPLTLLEAMQAGIPIVATDVGEIPRVLEQGRLGALVPPGDFKALASAIGTVWLDREAARAKASAARQRALKDYSAERMANRYLALYRSVAAARRCRAPFRGSNSRI